MTRTLPRDLVKIVLLLLSAYYLISVILATGLHCLLQERK